MITQTLTGAWQFRQVGTPDWLPASVPGGVHTDLLAAGRIPNPFAGENEKQVQWVADQDWEYRREFAVEPALLAEERVELVCGGLDTLAELSLNGQSLGQTDNMFRRYRWEVKGMLRPGANTLAIVFRSPVAYITARQKARKLPAMMNDGMAHLRKVPSHFGWDWGPVLPTSGIWREISLMGFSTARLTDVHLRQEHESGRVTLSAAAECERWGEESLTLSLTLTGPDGSVTHASGPVEGRRAALTLPVENPRLWWPNGLGPQPGAQPLYQAEVALLSGEQSLDRRSYQVGLRTIELRQEADEWGESFIFAVNGVPIFAKGANWIPADSFVTRLTYAQLEHLIQSAAAANMNVLRVWGGGYYEDERFYDLCDRYGILVWQDFVFACAAYPLDEAGFVENVRVEVVENVRRLRHRACLALWCGNNEIEMMWGLWRRHKSLTAACDRFFYHQLPQWVRTEDPDHAYWPSSPSSGDFMKDTNGDARGDTHLWQVWHGLKPFTYFRTRFTRCASEFGLEALPALDTIATFARPEEYGRKSGLKSSVLLHHQRSAGGNDKLVYYLTDRFRLPRDFADLVYLTQIVQAEAIRIGVEHWRRNRPRCAGALYWQLNDCWPVTSWASIDYDGRWKALQYAARRFFAPVALSLEDDGSRVGVYVANDTPAPWQGQVRWSLETLAGEGVESGQEPVAAAPLAATRVRAFDFAPRLRRHGRRTLVFVAELWQGEARQAGQRLACQVVAFAPERQMVLPEPDLTAQVQARDGGLEITISTRALARFVALSLPGADVVFSDNYFDLPAGRTARVTCPMPAGWSLEQAHHALQVRSLADVRPAGSPLSDRIQHHRAGLRPASLLTRVFFAFVK